MYVVFIVCRMYACPILHKVRPRPTCSLGRNTWSRTCSPRNLRLELPSRCPSLDAQATERVLRPWNILAGGRECGVPRRLVCLCLPPAFIDPGQGYGGGRSLSQWCCVGAGCWRGRWGHEVVVGGGWRLVPAGVLCCRRPGSPC